MKTSKPFSTISYNSEEFLTVKLNELIQSRDIAFWVFIEHYPEEDERKKHKHLYIVPNNRVDTEQVREYLTEVEPQNPTKPLLCIPCKSSKFADWYLYALHDTRYLASKGQSRKYHYTQKDLKTSDIDFLTEEVHTIDFTKLNRLETLLEAVDKQVPFSSLVRDGVVPIQQINSFKSAYDLMTYDTLQRSSRSTHTPIVEDTAYTDLGTGEVVEDTDLLTAFEIATWHTKKNT